MPTESSALPSPSLVSWFANCIATFPRGQSNGTRENAARDFGSDFLAKEPFKQIRLTVLPGQVPLCLRYDTQFASALLRKDEIGCARQDGLQERQAAKNPVIQRLEWTTLERARIVLNARLQPLLSREF